jgi:hypothetical protein
MAMTMAHAVAAAQVGRPTAPLSGVVVDKDGGAIPGATVVVTDQATAVPLAPVTTNRAGIFSFPALQPGTYSVDASRIGFKTARVRDVRMLTGVPADLGRVVLEVGAVTERVEVVAPVELVQTRTTSVTSTIVSDQIANLPLISRNVLNFVTFLPGVDVGGLHNQRTNVQIAGLPQSTLAITIDGVNTQDNYAKSLDGFFSIIVPTLDAIQEATVSSAAPTADAAGQGAVQIRMTTRAGTSEYKGTVYEYFRHPRLNANSFFNVANRLEKNQIKLHQYGGTIGGPLVLPKFNGRNRAFFFGNYEELQQPFDVSRTRIVLNEPAQLGNFGYRAGGVARTVNVLTLAAGGGQVSTVDPVIGKLLSDISAAAKTTGTLSPNADPNTSSLAYNPASRQSRHLLSTRFDVNLSERHRLTSTYYFQKFNTDPDLGGALEPKFPGFPSHGAQYSYRNMASTTVRSVLKPNIVNEAVFGFLWTPAYLGSDITLGQFQNQGGFALGFAGPGAFAGLTIPTAGSNSPSSAAGNNPSARNAWDWNIDEHLYWQRGTHSLHFGGGFIQFKGWTKDQQPAAAVTFGLDTANDPAASLFNTANFPGASTGNLADARYLYALLTGRVASIQGQLALDKETNQYVYGGVADRRVHMSETSLFVQDSWLVRPNLTLNFGLRYELQFPIAPEGSLYSMVTMEDACGISGTGTRFGTKCNLFSPGTLAGRNPGGYQRYDAGRPGYNTDFNNFAPNAGVAWLPQARGGWLKGLLGDPDQAVLRAGYGRAYTREGLRDMATRFESNPGVFSQIVRNASAANLVRPGEAWPLLLRQTSRLGPADFTPSPAYPLAMTRTSGLNLYDPDWQVGYVDSFSVGFQRGISKNMAVEVRYVGTRANKLRESENWNEVDLVENGFIDEYRLAQANLYANIAAGRGQTIAYFGAGSGTSPLPTYLGYYTGQSAALATNPARYTGANWANPAFNSLFQRLNPMPTQAAANLSNNATFRNNAAAAGLPLNYFQLNPAVGPVVVDVSKGFTRYDALQMDLRRHLSGGLAFNVNYTYAKRWASRLETLRLDRYLVRSVDAVPHALKLATTYEVPFGRTRRFGANVNRWVDGFAGGWQLNLTGKVQSGRILNYGSVRVMGMSEDALEDAIEYRVTRAADGTTRVFNLPQDIIDNTIRAFSTNVLGYTAGEPTGRYIAPANHPNCIQTNLGDCAPRDVLLTAPKYTRFDASAKKVVSLGGRKTFTFEVDVYNLFNAINFNPTISTFPILDSFRVTSSYSDTTGTFDPGSRTGQIVLRFSF